MRGRDEAAASSGLRMLVWTDGGDAHGRADYHRWLTEAGYGPIRTHDLGHPPQTVVPSATCSPRTSTVRSPSPRRWTSAWSASTWSGLGREGGKHGIEEFLEQKLIVLPNR